MKKQNRDFKGIWISKEIWLTKDLTLQEKVFLVEIDSLDNENGCFASNSYFGDFFGLSPHRVSQVISSLVKKKYVSADYVYKGKEIDKRVLRICHGGIKKKSRGSSESVKDNNTSNNKINNTSNKEKIDIIEKSICQEILDYWNTKEIIVHSKLTTKTKTKIKSTLREHDLDNIKFAIDNYSTVLESDKYVWSYKWTLTEFLQRGLERFNFDGCVDRLPKTDTQSAPPIIKPQINLEEVKADLDDALMSASEFKEQLDSEYGRGWTPDQIKPGWREQWEQLTTKIKILQSKLKGE
jgi:hypothetical protein